MKRSSKIINLSDDGPKPGPNSGINSGSNKPKPKGN